MHNKLSAMESIMPWSISRRNFIALSAFFASACMAANTFASESADAEYAKRHLRIEEIAHCYGSANDPAIAELARTAAWIGARWKESSSSMVLANHLR
jgi:hypothetical protein